MIVLELKKVYKKKYVLLTVLFAFIMSIFTFYFSEQSLNSIDTVFINAPAKSYVSAYFYDIDFNSIDNSHLSSKNIEDIMYKRDEIQKKFNMDIIGLLNEQDIVKKVAGFSSLYYSYFDSLEQLRNSYHIKLDSENQYNWDWLLLESKYNVDNNTPHVGIESYFLSRNPMRMVIRGSEVIFGIFPILFLIFLFASSVSDEKIKGNLNLLRVQPISKFRIIFSKWLSMMMIAMIYLLFSLLFLYFICKIYGYQWFNGHLELYRIFNVTKIEYILGYELLFKIIVAFIIMVMFFSAVIIFISSIVKEYKITIIILFLLISVLSIIMHSNNNLRTIFNPVYLMDIRNFLIGYFVPNYQMDSGFIYNYSMSFYYYFWYLFLSFCLLPISALFLNFNFDNKSKKQIRHIKSLYGFEVMKIINYNSFKITLIGIVFLMFILGFKLHIDDKNTDILFGSTSFGKLNSYVNMRENFIQKEGSIPKELYDSTLKEMNQKIKHLQLINDKFKNRQMYYSNNDSESYYTIGVEDMYYVRKSYEESKTLPQSPNIIDSRFTLPSYLESNKIYNYLLENQHPTVKLKGDLFTSEYEKLKIHRQFYKLDTIREHSASYLMRRLMVTFPMDLMVIALIIFTVLGGYAYDKEQGNQVCFIHTLPISRKRYYWYKFLATFLVSLFMLIFIFIIIFLIGLLFGGIGDFNFPIVYYDKLVKHFTLSTSEYFHIIPIWKYIINLIFILLLQLAFISSIGNLISIYVKERMRVFLIMLFIIIIGMFSSILIPKFLVIFCPFTYLRANMIANGSIIINYNIINYNVWIAIIILILSTILLLIIGMKLVEKKDLN